MNLLTYLSIYPSIHLITLLPLTHNCKNRKIKELLFSSSLRKIWSCQPTPRNMDGLPVSTTPLTSRTPQSNASSKNSATLSGLHCPKKNWKRWGGHGFRITNLYLRLSCSEDRNITYIQTFLVFR